MKTIQTTLYQEMRTFYQIIHHYDEKASARLGGLMSKLVRQARQHLNDDMNLQQKLDALLHLFYQQWQFHCSSEDYFLSQNIDLVEVLQGRKGMPVSLGAILLYLAEKLDLPLYPINFPTQLVLRAELENEVRFINPWNGEYLHKSLLQKWFQGAMGIAVPMVSQDLAIAEADQLLYRFRQLAKNALIREERNDDAFRYIEYLMSHYPDDPYEVRDRGLVMAQMGYYNAAREDLDYFIDQCPEDPTSHLLKTQLLEFKENAICVH